MDQSEHAANLVRLIADIESLHDKLSPDSLRRPLPDLVLDPDYGPPIASIVTRAGELELSGAQTLDALLADAKVQLEQTRAP